MAAFIYLFLAAGLTASAVIIRAARYFAGQSSALIARAEQAEQTCVDLRAELETIRARRHTQATTAMIEDLQSILLDLDGEIKTSYRYLAARLKNAAAVLQTGRAGPHAYTPAPTHQRPKRPGTIKLWSD